MQVYTDPDPIGKVLRTEHGQVNIEVKSAHSIGEEAKLKKMCNDPQVISKPIIGPHEKQMEMISPINAKRVDGAVSIS